MRPAFLGMSWLERRNVVRVMSLVVALSAVPSVGDAHHSRFELSVPSATCGWVDGEDLRDRRNLAVFCTESVPGELRIKSASAVRERLWIEASPDLAPTMREDDRTTAALLRNWLDHWRKTSGYKTASVILLRRHVEFARIQTTMTGDVVTLR